MNNAQPELPAAHQKIATLIDRQREGLFVIAFCPICDHAEEAKDNGAGHGRTESVSIDKIKVHIHKRHRVKPRKVGISTARRA